MVAPESIADVDQPLPRDAGEVGVAPRAFPPSRSRVPVKRGPIGEGVRAGHRRMPRATAERPKSREPTM